MDDAKLLTVDAHHNTTLVVIRRRWFILPAFLKEIHSYKRKISNENAEITFLKTKIGNNRTLTGHGIAQQKQET